MRHGCLLCRRDELVPLLDVGPQPISNRFLRSAGEPEERFPIALLQCGGCGLVQIDTPVPAKALVPPYDWITYSEPEGHLDDLVDVLMRLPGIAAGAVAGGISFKDDSTLARLERRGLRTWRLDLRQDLEVADAGHGHGVETVQDRLTPEAARRIVQERGQADLLLVRHILEHASDPLVLIEALKVLTRPGGYLVFEVPDCGRAMDAGDYTTIWEEHTLYFTPDTFFGGLSFADCTVVHTGNYPYPFENSLVAVAQADGGRSGRPAPGVARERARGAAFGRRFAESRQKIQRCLHEHRRTRGRIALFGAGHLACMYVNVFDVAAAIDCTIDDNPHKQGLYMPGSRLPIVGSPVLRERDISLCLLSLNPIGEEKVIEKNAGFVNRGGIFASIFPASARALTL